MFYVYLFFQLSSTPLRLFIFSTSVTPLRLFGPLRLLNFHRFSPPYVYLHPYVYLKVRYRGFWGYRNKLFHLNNKKEYFFKNFLTPSLAYKTKY